MMNICIFYMFQIWRYLKQRIFIIGQIVHILLSKEKLYKSLSLRLEKVVGREVLHIYLHFSQFSLHLIPIQGSLTGGGALFLKISKSTVQA